MWLGWIWTLSCAHIEIPYDGLDQDRDGFDAVDMDCDGHASLLVGGWDCDDRRDWIYPGAYDDPGDGVDADCDGDDPEADGLSEGIDPMDRPRPAAVACSI